MDDLEGELRDEDIQQDSPDDSQVSYYFEHFKFYLYFFPNLLVCTLKT